MSMRFPEKVRIVIGANYGDEGKGLMTDYFAGDAISSGKSCLVICSNGGAQRGHTVTLPDGRRHVFHHFGSGTFAGADSYLCRNYILNPILYQEERKMLEKDGVCPKGHVFADPSCIWSTPYDMMVNQIVEEYRGKERHGSCGLGIWETIVRSRACYIPFTRFEKDEDGLRQYLRQIREEYLPYRLKQLGVSEIPAFWRKLLKNEELISHYIDDFMSMTGHFEKRNEMILRDYDDLVFENAQGLLLDRNRIEFGDHTTPSNTGIRNPAAMLDGISHGSDVEVCYVTRTYLTRHGAGPFPGECTKKDLRLKENDKTNVPNPFQGTLRYGKMDTAQLKERIFADYSSLPEAAKAGWRISLAVTHLNESDNRILTEEALDLPRFASEMQVGKIYVSSGMDRKSVREWSIEKDDREKSASG